MRTLRPKWAERFFDGVEKGRGLLTLTISKGNPEARIHMDDHPGVGEVQDRLQVLELLVVGRRTLHSPMFDDDDDLDIRKV